MLTYASWIADRDRLARELSGSTSPWRYADGIIPLCVSINAMASSLWIEETRNDRNRFIELVARFGGGDGVDPTTVSRPLLAQSKPAWRAAVPVSRINWALTGDDDLPETEIVPKHPDPAKADDLKRKEIRKFSYASLLYSEIRCGFIHTYRASNPPRRAMLLEASSMLPLCR